MAETRPRRMPLDECVRAFLELVISEPERAPRTQRAKRENEMIVHGYNRAQETLRAILEHHGTPAARRLADVRARGQQRPIDIGGQRAWLV